MAQTFNTSISFVQSTSRKDRRKGAGSPSVSAFGGGGGNVADSATQAWVRNNFVDKTTEQEISAPKIFSQGIKIGDIAFYRHPDGYVYLDETLVLKGGVVMYGNSSGVDVPSIFDSLPIDGLTIKRDGNGALYVDETALSVSGGGGGGGVADSVHWNNVTGKPSWIGSTKPSYKYSEIEESPDLSVYALNTTIPTKLSQLTDDVVAGNYLPLSGGTISTSATDVLTINRQSDTSTGYIAFRGNGTLRGRFGFNASNNPVVQDLNYGTDNKILLHSGNYSDLLANGTINGSITLNNPTSNTPFEGAITLDAKSYGSKSYSQIRFKNGSDVSTRYGFINLKSDTYGHGSGVEIGRRNGDSTTIWASIDASGITATSFIGNLTGNADSATKLATARTIWGQSFDGTGNITGVMTVDGDATFSSKVVIGTIPVYQSADGTLFVDANVVFRGGVAMYGDSTTTINEE